MKQFFLLSLAFCGFITSANAQLVVKINDKAIAENATVNTADISKMEISFSNLKKPKAYSLGRLVFEIIFTDLNGREPMQYNIVKSGENAIADFLSEPVQNFVLYEKDGANDAFKALVGYDNPKGVRECLDKLSSDQSAMKFKVKVAIYFQDKITYDSYGDPFNLAKPVNFNVNNMRADGAVVLGGSGGIRLSAAGITATNYFSSFVDKNVLKSQPTGFTSTEVSHTCLKIAPQTYHRVSINTVDCGSKTQDEVINGLKTKADLIVLRMANVCNKSLRAKIGEMSVEEEKGWGQLFTEGSYAVCAPAFNKEETKEWDKKKPFEAFTAGKLTGFKFSSVFRNSYCKDDAAKRPYTGHASVFILKHPTDSKKVLVIFNRCDRQSSSVADAADAAAAAQKFVENLEF
jgi:hypothetical protein